MMMWCELMIAICDDCDDDEYNGHNMWYDSIFLRIQNDYWRWDWVDLSLTDFQEKDNETLRIYFHKLDFWFEVQLGFWLKSNWSSNLIQTNCEGRKKWYNGLVFALLHTCIVELATTWQVLQWWLCKVSSVTKWCKKMAKSSVSRDKCILFVVIYWIE